MVVEMMGAGAFAGCLLDFAQVLRPTRAPTVDAMFVGRVAEDGGWQLLFTRAALMAWAEVENQLLAIELRRTRRDSVLKALVAKTFEVHLLGEQVRTLPLASPPWYAVHASVLKVRLWQPVGEQRMATAHSPASGRGFEFLV
jgi:hypothetical protein